MGFGAANIQSQKEKLMKMAEKESSLRKVIYGAFIIQSCVTQLKTVEYSVKIKEGLGFDSLPWISEKCRNWTEGRFWTFTANK
jgi:hypothetical protein